MRDGSCVMDHAPLPRNNLHKHQQLQQRTLVLSAGQSSVKTTATLSCVLGQHQVTPTQLTLKTLKCWSPPRARRHRRIRRRLRKHRPPCRRRQRTDHRRHRNGRRPREPQGRPLHSGRGGGGAHRSVGWSVGLLEEFFGRVNVGGQPMGSRGGGHRELRTSKYPGLTNGSGRS
jgi:hypothetical protein